MKDNETIKAFEEKVRLIGSMTFVYLDREDGLDLYEVMSDALDLINRQKAEIKQKDTEIDILIRKKETLKDEISELGEEVKRVNNEYRVMQRDLLNEIRALEYQLETDKAEARKEFAARLKVGVPQETGVIRCADIDNLLEEMESERE